MTASPIAPASPLDGIDAALAERLLSAALSSGGEYADLFFEYRSGADYVLEDGRILTVGAASRWASACACCAATRPATRTPRSSTRSGWPRRRAPRRRSRPAAPRRGRSPSRPVAARRSLPRRASRRSTRRRREASRCCGGPTRRRAPTTRASSASRRRFAEEIARDARRRRPTASWRATASRCFASACAPSPRRAASGRAALGRRRRRFGMEYFARAGQSPRSTGARRRAWRSAMLDAVRGAGRDRWRSCWAPGESGILLHEAVGHGLEADFNRKRTSNYTDQVGKQVASPLCTVVDDGTIDNARGSINVDDEGNAGQRNVLIEDGTLVGYMQDRLSAQALRRQAVGQRAPPELPARADAAHDQHLHGARPRRSRGHHQVGQARRVRQALRRRAGEHLERRLRVRADRELSDRGRQADRAAQGRRT